jgi:hypothetical protein
MMVDRTFFHEYVRVYILVHSQHWFLLIWFAHVQGYCEGHDCEMWYSTQPLIGQRLKPKPLIPHHIPQQIKLIEGHSNWSNDWGPLLGKMGKKVHLADLAAYQWCGCSFEMTHVFLTLVWSRDAMGQFPVPWVTSFRHCFYITALAVSIIGGTYTIYKYYVRPM